MGRYSSKFSKSRVAKLQKINQEVEKRLIEQR